jgi:hypothetical protein
LSPRRCFIHIHQKSGIRRELMHDLVSAGKTVSLNLLPAKTPGPLSLKPTILPIGHSSERAKVRPHHPWYVHSQRKRLDLATPAEQDNHPRVECVHRKPDSDNNRAIFSSSRSRGSIFRLWLYIPISCTSPAFLIFSVIHSCNSGTGFRPYGTF